MLQALFNQVLDFDDLAPIDLAVFVGHFHQVAQVGLTVAFGGVFIGAGDFQSRGQWDGAAPYAFYQELSKPKLFTLPLAST